VKPKRVGRDGIAGQGINGYEGSIIEKLNEFKEIINSRK
jgi:hypothetical protein